MDMCLSGLVRYPDKYGIDIFKCRSNSCFICLCTAATTVVSAEDSAITVAKATAVSASVSTGIPGLSVKSTSGEIPPEAP